MEQTKKYYLNPSELAILLANVGVKKLYGLNTNKDLDNKEVCIALHNLYLNKLIDNYDSESFQVNKEICCIIKGIKEARYVLIIQSDGENGKYMCCYLGQEISVVSLRKGMRDKLAIYLETQEHLINELIDTEAEEKISLSISKADTGEKKEQLEILDDSSCQEIKQLLEKYCVEE